jgi:hypothetical protein
LFNITINIDSANDDFQSIARRVNTLINLRDKLTRLNGVITPKTVDKLEDELGGIFTVAKTHHYYQGQKYGHLASAFRDAAGPACQTDRTNGGDQQSEHEFDNGAVERTPGSTRRKTDEPTGQGENSSGRQR